MEVILAIAIGVLGGSGVWLVLRPRTFQVLMGLALLSYAVNLFIFSMGSLSLDQEPIVQPGLVPSLQNYTDPLPQALVLTAIVIGFATTALFLVVLLASRGLSDTDHVDGEEPDNGTAPWPHRVESKKEPPLPRGQDWSKGAPSITNSGAFDHPPERPR